MAMAMEVAWRRGGGVGELASSSTPSGVSIQDVEASLKMKNNAGSTNKMNKRAWGADAHKLVQLMMNPLQQQQQQQQSHAGEELGGKKVADVQEEEEEFTLDLLGASSPPTKLQKLEEEKDELRELEPRSPEFLELQPADQPLPLPSGWEKCLDLKTGKLYFVNKSTGMSTSPEITNNKCCTHKFLNSKLKSSSSSELEELIQASTCPQSALMGSKPPLLAFSTGSKQLNIIKTPQGDHHHAKDQEISTSKFALDLNLTASGSTSPSHHQSSQPQHQHQQDQVEQLRAELSSAAVCTMEMVQRALNRAEKAMGKREMQAPRNSHRHHNHHHDHHHSGAAASSSSSSAHVGGAMSEATSSRSPNSTSSSNSSSTSSTSSAGLLAGSSGGGAAPPPPPTTTTRATTEGGILEVLKEEQTVDDPFVVTSESGVWEGGESKEDSFQRKMKDGKDESEATASGQSMLVMGACTRCLMYVMLNKCDPKCPRCESQVPLDFTNATHPPPSKRQRLERHESPSDHAQV